ncbi:serine hydrolase domain-containing protein [Chitinimonas sp. JJ19]|uniref:serine hydrolase domain-containing protein n=1 Tax=Chitinimonas sp. JJ19 TaxID=3109352 RepID=UPI003001A877
MQTNAFSKKNSHVRTKDVTAVAVVTVALAVCVAETLHPITPQAPTMLLALISPLALATHPVPPYTAALAQLPDRPFRGVALISQAGAIQWQYQQLAAADLPPRFVIGSLTKQITAAIVLREVDAGRAQLDAPVGKYLPQLDPAWRSQVTLRQLLDHTAGLTGEAGPPSTPPGSQFAYSNRAYDLLGHVAASSSGQSYEQLAKDVFRLCGMHSAAVQDQQPRQPGLQEQEDGALQPAKGATSVASGGIVASADDLVRWQACLHGGKLLSSASYRAMVTPSSQRPHRWGTLAYGLGLQISQADGLLEYSHSGYTAGYIATLSYYPASQTSMVVLESTSWRSSDIVRAFAPHDSLRALLRQHLQAPSATRPPG